MRILIQCPECRRAASRDTKEYFVERDPGSGAYIHHCENGHAFSAILKNPLHEVLFESGVTALLMGFNREALASFHVALERYYELATDIMIRHLGVSDEAQITAMWKHAHLSEREFGAFVSTYLAAFKRSFGYSKELKSLTERRNSVIHAGMVPLEADVIRHGECIYKIVHETNDALIELTSNNALRTLEYGGVGEAANKIRT